MQFWIKRFPRTSSENFPISRRSNYEVYIPCYDCLGFLGLEKRAKILRILLSRCRRRGQFSLGTSLTKFKGSAIHEIKEDSRGRLLLKMHLSLYRFTFIRMWKLRKQLKWNLTFAIVFMTELCFLGCRKNCKRKYMIAHVREFTRYGQNGDWSSLYILTDTPARVCVR